MHIPNTTEIIDKKQGNSLNHHIGTLLTISRNSPEYMSKTIFNNLNKGVKGLKKYICETHSNYTNDIVIKNQMKKNIL